MLAIFRRDLSAYFNSITVWVLTAAYLFVSGLICTLMVSNFVESSMGGAMSGRTPNIMDELVLGYQWWLGFLMIFLLPMLTMRLLAEEKRIGTLELLFTYPVNEWEIVLAKFFASFLTVLGMLGLSCISLAYLSSKTPLDWTLVASGYAGLALMASTLIAIGLWASSLSASQVIAACITYGLAMTLWLMQLLDSKFLPTKLVEGFGEDSKGIGSLGIMTHLESFARGNISSHDIVYYLCLTILFLFLTVRVLDSRKWRM
jgi:ABC-2 type transport system permease protein